MTAAKDAAADEKPALAFRGMRLISRDLECNRVVVEIEIDPDQWWFWTPEWLEGEAEADDDIAAGRFERFYSAEEFLAALERDSSGQE